MDILLRIVENVYIIIILNVGLLCQIQSHEYFLYT